MKEKRSNPTKSKAWVFRFGDEGCSPSSFARGSPMIAKTKPSPLEELKPLKRRKRSAAERAFRRGMSRVRR